MIVRSDTVSNIKGVFSKPFELSLIVPIDELLKRSGESVPFEVLIIVSPGKFQNMHFKIDSVNKTHFYKSIWMVIYPSVLSLCFAHHFGSLVT